MDYVAWGTTSLGGFASTELLQNFRDRADLRTGESLADRFPNDAVFAMNPKFRKDTALADAIATREGDGVMLVSAALREHLEAFDCPNLEFLDVAIHDHDGEVVSTSHSIANPFEVLDALDLDAMGVMRNPLDGSIMSCQRVVLDVSKLGDEPVMFRAKGFEGRILVRRDVADEITEKGFTGVYFHELSEVRA